MLLPSAKDGVASCREAYFEAVASLPGVFRHSVDQVVSEAKAVFDAGVPAVILFGVPEHKDARGSGADAAGGISYDRRGRGF